jgi:hypothetical protein
VSFEAAEGSTLSETLNGTQYGKKNSVWGFIDYLIDWEGYVDPQEIALRIVMEENALCRDLGPDYWPTPLASWFDDFVSRITPGVIERTGGIQFG